jgi:uncharacterized protein (DUF1684 family)
VIESTKQNDARTPPRQALPPDAAVTPAASGSMDTTVPGILSLAEWRRKISELYASVRSDPDPARAWERWCLTRRILFTTHPQSPIPEDQRAEYRGPHVFPYDSFARVRARLEPLAVVGADVATSDGRSTRMLRFARARFELHAHPAALDVFWLDQYGGGLYLAFRDATSGETTYGGGRYLLDTIKGADIGGDDDILVLDFNFAYQPSCSYDPRWSCPLPPPENTLGFEIQAGERSAGRDLVG